MENLNDTFEKIIGQKSKGMKQSRNVVRKKVGKIKFETNREK